MRSDSPTFLFLQTNQRCNLRCESCDFWKLNDDDRSGYLTRAQRFQVLREFRDIGGKVMVTCGGEPMLDVQDYFALMQMVRDLGMRAFSVVNGTRIHNVERAEQMVTVGPHEVTVSLNSQNEAEHDRSRGVKGSFAVATKALRLLVDARKRLQTPTKIYAMTIVHEQNYRELESFYEMVFAMGVDKLKLNIIQPTFGIAGDAPDNFFAKYQVQDTADLVRVIRKCDERFKLNINPVWLHQVKMYFDSIRKRGTPIAGWNSRIGTAEHICNTYDRNIMIDLWGEMRLCFSHNFPGKLFRNSGDLTDFWQNFSTSVKESMLGCNRYCGISHSVRREHATLKVVP